MNSKKNFHLRFYRHYKNKPYEYIDVVKHSETLEELVFYKCRYENDHGKLWVRPKGMFHEKVKIENEWKDRFEPIQFSLFTIVKMNAETKINLNKLFKDIFGEELSESKWAKHNPESKNVILWVVTEEKNPEKWIAFKLAYHSAQGELYSWLGGVQKDYKGLGIGQYLTREMIQYAKDNSIQLITTKTLNTNTPQIISNLKSGLQIVGSENSHRGLKLVFHLNL